MANEVRSQSLIDVEGLSGDTTYVVPAGQRLVVTNVQYYIGAASNAVVSAKTSADNASFLADSLTSVLTPVSGQWVGRRTLEEGHTLTIHVDGGPADVSADGYLLALP